MNLRLNGLSLCLLMRWLAAGLLVCMAGSARMDAQAAVRTRVQVLNVEGTQIAGRTAAPNARDLALHFMHDYQPGDRLVVEGPAHLLVTLEQGRAACELHRPHAGAWSFVLPFGTGEMQPGSAYAPGAFAALEHTVRVHALTRRELAARRNLAVNACDQTNTMEPAAFPHATASSVYHQMPVFAARNAIDGERANTHHGAWPYQSWGPDKADGFWWQLDFGRMVELDEVRLVLRADFPHDSYWKQATLEFSDGSTQTLTLTRSTAAQEFRFPVHRTAWIRLTHLLPAESSGWCALTEVEAWGHDLL